jgi:DNA invertase Pin-like site-specific DNA recombinase
LIQSYVVKLRAAIYCRISSDRDDERLGVDRQETDCRKLCAENQWAVVSPIYCDNNVSAADPRQKRPEYERLLRDIAEGRVDVVVVWDLDRLHRRPIELEGFWEACHKAGVTKLASVAGEVDFGTGEGMLVARVKGAVAAEEARKISRRVRRKQQELAERGKPAGGGTRPFGFEKDGMTIRADEAALIREAADKLLGGASLYSVQQEWESDEVPTAKGTRADGTRVKWSVTSIKTTLTRPRIAGLRQYQGQVVGDAAWPPILDRETWERLSVVLTDPSRRQPPPSREYPLYPLLRCGCCGRQLTAMPRKNGRNYGCRKYSGGCGHVFIAAGRIEPYVLSVVLPVADSPALLNAIEVANTDVETEVRTLVVAIAEDEHARAQLGDDHYQARVIDRATYLRQDLALRTRIDVNRARLGAIQRPGSLDQLGGRVAEEWPQLSAEQRRQLLGSVLRAVTVQPATRRGSNIFDRSRVAFDWRWDALVKIAEGYAKTMTDADWALAEDEYSKLCAAANEGD